MKNRLLMWRPSADAVRIRWHVLCCVLCGASVMTVVPTARAQSDVVDSPIGSVVDRTTTSMIETIAARAPIQSPSLQERLIRLNDTLGSPAVSARVDRVWHAVPGLCGWQLDIDQSITLTRRLNDSNVHLRWRKIVPLETMSKLRAEPVYRGSDAEKSMALMFNVSWGTEYVPAILDVLRRQRVHGTFFLDGSWVVKHPDLVQRIAREGHAIGSHGSGHPDFRHLSDAKLEQQVTLTNAQIGHTLGRTVDLLAPPAGAYDARTVRIARAHQMYTILWSLDSIDWQRPAAGVIVDRVVNQEMPGGLVLMHPTAPTVAALPTLITRLQRDGYYLKTVEDVVHEVRAVAPPDRLSR